MSPLDIHTTIRKATRLEFHPPKSKHLLALKNMTLDEPASIDDILILLEKRLNERSWIITFKVFIILHYLMREGNCVRVVDAVIKKPSVLDASKIKQKTQNIENIYMYKNYIDERIVAFRHTRRDYAANEAKFSTIRRNSAVGGRRLSHITVKEGLLKEMKALQRQLDAILQCKFNMEDSKKASEITSFAFRMVLDDLLTLFQSVNEGVCNILDHYFKMKKSDAQTALGIYKRFAHQTELTMDYLNHVQMIQSELQVRDIPSQIEHAPLSMTAALEDHLLKAKDEDMEEVWQKDKGK
ncbi:AP180 N-terminal homology domain-containing protein [Mycotypha africana]|uniref:uncharacterized protein n=1 Tax=Mycotypha africana TaxID=64632 RepID=UPI0023012ABD|nr:uncharacterized protein BDF20DRAFT_825890 [Mycotypha africana]KAI8970466.1 AP180 N-terminal homology domain-containing protein [Mycotypha africana]